MRRIGWALAMVSAMASGTALSPATTAAQDRGMALLERASDVYAGVQTLCADFVQRLEVPLLGNERTGRGRLCQARPNLFAMRFTEPQGDMVVIDGTKFVYYFPSNDARQAFSAPVERAGGQDFHREFLENPSQKYTVTYEAEESLGGARTHRLRLVPKTRASYRSATLWIEDGTSMLRQLRTEEQSGNLRTVTLSNIQFDVAPPAGFFVFTPPRGVVTMEIPQ